jgi:uncharacterized membrane protein
MEWLRMHVFLVAWITPIVTLIGMILKRQPQGTPINWANVVLYVGFLSGIAMLVTPGVSPFAQGFAVVLVITIVSTLLRSYRS